MWDKAARLGAKELDKIKAVMVPWYFCGYFKRKNLDINEWEVGGAIIAMAIGNKFRYKDKTSFKMQDLVKLFSNLVYIACKYGYYYTDVKPSNIVVDDDGSPTMCDFPSFQYYKDFTQVITSYYYRRYHHECPDISKDSTDTERRLALETAMVFAILSTMIVVLFPNDEDYRFWASHESVHDKEWDMYGPFTQKIVEDIKRNVKDPKVKAKISQIFTTFNGYSFDYSNPGTTSNTFYELLSSCL